MKYLQKFLLVLCFLLLAVFSAEATTYTLRTLSSGTAVSAGDLFESRQGADTSDVSVTAAQLKTFTSASPTLVTPTIGVATATSVTLTTSGSIVAKASGDTTDINPAFGTAILGNPVVKVAYGTCTVSAVNAGTCVPLVGATSRTITVTNFDIIATGSAATCTGVLLEDNNGTPVVIATLAAATLTSGAHNIPLTATLGVGFGAGSGLTVAKGVQIIVNGSGCTTTTSFQYAITYTVQ